MSDKTRNPHRLIELAFVLTAAILPTFLMAGSIDSDEYAKGGTTGTMLLVFAAYKAWKGSES